MKHLLLLITLLLATTNLLCKNNYTHSTDSGQISENIIIGARNANFTPKDTCYNLGAVVLCPKEKVVMGWEWFGTETKDGIRTVRDSTINYNTTTLEFIGEYVLFSEQLGDMDIASAKILLYTMGYVLGEDKNGLFAYSPNRFFNRIKTDKIKRVSPFVYIDDDNNFRFYFEHSKTFPIIPQKYDIDKETFRPLCFKSAYVYADKNALYLVTFANGGTDSVDIKVLDTGGDINKILLQREYFTYNNKDFDYTGRFIKPHQTQNSVPIGYAVRNGVLYDNGGLSVFQSDEFDLKNFHRVGYTQFNTDGNYLIMPAKGGKRLTEINGYDQRFLDSRDMTKGIDTASLKIINQHTLIDKNNIYTIALNRISVIPIKEIGLPFVVLPVEQIFGE